MVTRSRLPAGFRCGSGMTPHYRYLQLADQVENSLQDINPTLGSWQNEAQIWSKWACTFWPKFPLWRLSNFSPEKFGWPTVYVPQEELRQSLTMNIFKYN